MESKRSKGGWWWLVLLTACSSNEGGAKQVGGGQSGTDSQGACGCYLDDAVAESVPLDQVPVGFSCSPKALFEPFEGSWVFQCNDDSLTLNVTRGSSAWLLTGKRYNDVGDPGTPMPCEGLSVDVSLEIRGSDGNVDFAGPSTLTMGRICSRSEVEAHVQGRKGKYDFILNDNSRLIFSPDGGETDYCHPPTQSVAGSAGVEPVLRRGCSVAYAGAGGQRQD